MTLATLAVAALAAWPAMPLGWVIFATAVVGFGVGTVFPVATVSIQNAVERHDVGTATGAMNFFRALASALVVAIMGAILLAGLGVTPERGGVGVELTVANAGAAGVAVAEVFRLVFVAALVFSILALVALVLLQERPLHGPAVKAPPVTPDATPAE
jgi:MFS family permease